MLLDKLNQDLKSALKNGDTNRVSSLRFVLAQVKNKEIEKRGSNSGRESGLSDEEVIEVLRKEAKKLKESLDVYKKENRQDLADKEAGQLVVVEEYLPKLLDRGEIEKAIDQAIKDGFTDFGSLMKEVVGRLRGQADGKTVSEVARERLKS